jgi:proline iminopeptidase
MEAWYFSHNCFLQPGQLLRDAHRLTGIPGVIVQGELDHLCPPTQARTLATFWPEAELQIVPGAGHSLGESAIAAALRAAIARFA